MHRRSLKTAQCAVHQPGGATVFIHCSSVADTGRAAKTSDVTINNNDVNSTIRLIQSTLRTSSSIDMLVSITIANAYLVASTEYEHFDVFTSSI